MNETPNTYRTAFELSCIVNLRPGLQTPTRLGYLPKILHQAIVSIHSSGIRGPLYHRRFQAFSLRLLHHHCHRYFRLLLLLHHRRRDQPVGSLYSLVLIFACSSYCMESFRPQREHRTIEGKIINTIHRLWETQTAQGCYTENSVVM